MHEYFLQKNSFEIVWKEKKRKWSHYFKRYVPFHETLKALKIVIVRLVNWPERFFLFCTFASQIKVYDNIKYKTNSY
jgi:hypothetical protein